MLVVQPESVSSVLFIASLIVIGALAVMLSSFVPPARETPDIAGDTVMGGDVSYASFPSAVMLDTSMPSTVDNPLNAVCIAEAELLESVESASLMVTVSPLAVTLRASEVFASIVNFRPFEPVPITPDVMVSSLPVVTSNVFVALSPPVGGKLA